MGYALKLQSVNFSSVALDQVTFEERVPCTAISLSPSTLSFDTAEGTAQLTASLTPSSTTDEVLWSSSNEDVATVSDEGLVTIHGLGSATITATCGEQTATVSITQTMLKAPYEFTKLSNYTLGSQTVTDGKVLGVDYNSGQSCGAQAYHNTDDLRIRKYGPTDYIECIRVPYGATKVKYATTDGEQHRISYVEFVDTGTILTADNVKYPTWTKNNTFIYSDTGKTVEYGQAIAFRGASEDLALVAYVFFTNE